MQHTLMDRHRARAMRVIITGATGMVGEGVLLECLADSRIDAVLIVSRRPIDATYRKLQQCLRPDFRNADAVASELTGFDACCYCAGVSSAGMSEADYTRVTYDTPMAQSKAE